MSAADTVLPPVWPEGQKLSRWDDRNIVVTQFTDFPSYHPSLVEEVLSHTDDPDVARPYEQTDGIGSYKLFDVGAWGTPAATLIYNRALEMFRRVFKTSELHVDLSWASVYAKGDHCLPHSHPRTYAGVVYMLEPGDPPNDESGMFLFADARMPICCREEQGFMSTPCAPLLTPGMMIMFPGQAVHCVTPYLGKKPRITMSWNINRQAVPGEALRPHNRPPGKR
jgi:hypothetical protein